MSTVMSAPRLSRIINFSLVAEYGFRAHSSYCSQPLEDPPEPSRAKAGSGGTVPGSPLALGYPSPLPGWDGTYLL